MVLSVVMLILITFVKIELCRELLEVLALPRFSCTAGFFLASLIIQLSISVGKPWTVSFQ